jgi:SAM-dependent methyltransferase
MPNCIVCNSAIAPFGPCEGYTYFRCENCETIQLWPMPNQAEVERAYEQEYVAGKYAEHTFRGPEWWRTASRPYVQAIIRTIRDHGAEGAVIDYGAGWGHLVAALRETGFDATGLELSESEVAYAQDQKLPVQQGRLADLRNLDGKVSVITMSAVFEHLIDHSSVLSSVHRLLKDDGLFITMHPTATLFYLLANLVRLGDKKKELPYFVGAFTPPWHTVLFSISGSDQFISRFGFRLLEVRPAPQGRLGGFLGFVQVTLEQINKIGWILLGKRWPLLTTHIFVFQKVV